MTRLKTVALAFAVTLLGACAHFEGLDQSASHTATPTTAPSSTASTGAVSPTPPEPTAMQQAPSVAAPVADGDNDGVPNHLDRCPQTTAGTLVDASGCSVVSPALPPRAN